MTLNLTVVITESVESKDQCLISQVNVSALLLLSEKRMIEQTMINRRDHQEVRSDFT